MKQSEQVYYRFKDALLNGSIELGDTITQAELAKILDTQISPLRVAINKLEAEGLVDILPRSGIQIVKPDLELIRNSYQLRKIIEREAIKTYTRYAASASIKNLIKINEDILQQIDRDDAEEEILKNANEVDHATHDEFIKILENPLVSKVYETNNDKIKLIRLDKPVYLSPLLMREITKEHLKFLRSIQERDVESAATSLEEHLDNSVQRAMGIF